MKKTIDPNPGALVIFENRVWMITHRLGLNEVLIRCRDELAESSADHLRVSIHALQPYDAEVKGEPSFSQDIEAIPTRRLKIAEDRFKAIEPLLRIPRPDRTFEDVAQAAKVANKSKTTLYRWLDIYEKTKKLSSLLPVERRDTGKPRLDSRAEKIVNEVIEGRFLSPQRLRVTSIYEDIRILCNQVGVAPPHINSVYRRISKLPEFLTLARREGQKKAKARYSPSIDAPPDARWPLQTVEIDHTPLDLILLDSKERQPIGRAYLTWAEDTFSRQILGFCATLEPPSSLSVALCVAHAVLPKEGWLKERGIEGEWMCYGLMESIRVDNAPEFNSEALAKACNEYGIEIKYRPKGQPAFGGRIESSFRSLAQKIHTLPGTTFSNVEQRGDYPAEDMAVYSLDDIERWIGRIIVNEYQVSVHAALNSTPAKRYEQGIMGTQMQAGTGLPEIPANPEKLFIDFLPFQNRSVQRSGVSVFGLIYYDPMINRWIGSREPGRGARAKEFVVRYDPRNMRKVYFYDPELKQYIVLYLRNTGFPEFTLWELRDAKRRLKKEGQQHADEERVMASILKRRQEEADLIRYRKSVRSSKVARRNQERLRQASSTWDQHPSLEAKVPSDLASSSDLMDIAPFDEIRTLET